MASTSGLTRRRGAGTSGEGGSETGGTNAGGSPAGPNRNNSTNNFRDSGPETSYEENENGHKIAFDPRDISENAERGKQPKLTLMEEVLLLGLKDKQVSPTAQRARSYEIDPRCYKNSIADWPNSCV